MATVQGIYIALFGRPADPLGLAFFQDLTNDGADLTNISDLSNEPEYLDRFEGMSNVQIVNSIYQSLFGRDADLAGLTFFVNALQSGDQNINTIAINIYDGAQNDDLATLQNKEAAANLFTASLDTGAEVNAYQGEQAAAAGRAFLAGVTSDEATIPTQAQVDAAIAAIVAQEPVGNDFTLTDAIGENVVGTAGSDTFSAVLDTGAPGDSTLNLGDRIDGAGGTDTLDLILAGAADRALPNGVTIKNVEIVNLISSNGTATLDTTGAGEVSAAAFAGVQQLWQVDAFNDVIGAGAGVTVGFRGDGNAVANSVTFTSASGSVALDGVDDGSAVTFEGKSATVQLETVTVSGSVESPGGGVRGQLDLIAGAAANLNVETLNLNFTSNVDLTNATDLGAGTLIEFNASGSTGGLTVALGTWDASIESATFGSGKDIVTVSNSTEALTVDLGAGNDVVTFSGNAAGDTLDITLGAGSDVATFGGGSNVAVATAAKFEDSLITITDFNTAVGQDTFNGIVNGLSTQSLVTGAVDANATLFANLGAVAAAADDTTSQFVYDGDLYVYYDLNGDAEFNAGDALIKFEGVTDLLQIGVNIA